MSAMASVGVGLTLFGNETAAPALRWERWEDLPDAVGRKGMYGGASDGHVLLAGGSNFPVPPRDGGKKAFHRDVFVRPLPLSRAEPWRVAQFQLPDSLGEGAAVTTPEGAACVGGHDGRGPVSTAFLLRWNREQRDVEWRALPDLPEPVANAAAVLHNGWIYVAGGDGRAGAVGMFCRLEVARAAAEPQMTRWETLPTWPGPKRFGSILTVVTTDAGSRLLLAGGLPGPAKGQGDYLRDTLLFDPRSRAWTTAAAMPRGAVLAAAVPLGGAQAIVLGGSDGHGFERMRALGERYRIPSDVLLYDARADRWLTAGTMPLGVVGAAIFAVGTGWLVAGGEYSPGLRTAQVFTLRIARP